MLIMGISNRNLCEDFYEQIYKISKSKLDYLIIREKDMDNAELLKLALKVKELLKDTDIRIIINSNIFVAHEVDADGIQLSFDNFMSINNKLLTEDVANLKRMVDNFKINGNKYKMIGVSIHSYSEGIQAYSLGADYLVYGHVYETDCKKDLQPRGVKEIEALSKEVNIPIIGLGGIYKDNYKEVLYAGAKGIALMSSLMKSSEPKKLIKSFLYSL